MEKEQQTTVVEFKRDWQFFIRCPTCHALTMEERDTGALLTTVLGMPHACP